MRRMTTGKSYKPHPNRRVDIPKEQGKLRTLRIIYCAAVDVLDLQPDHLAGTQAATIAEAEQEANLRLLLAPRADLSRRRVR